MIQSKYQKHNSEINKKWTQMPQLPAKENRGITPERKKGIVPN
jgi:hypothetical protein